MPSRLALLFLSAISLICFLPKTALAACANPTGVAGAIIYNTDFAVMQYCNNTSWIAMGSRALGDGDMGDITISGSGASWMIDDDVLNFTELSDTLTLDASTDIAASGTNTLSITNTGTGNSLLVNDAASDTTPFVIDASGNVGIGIASPTNKLTVGASTGGVLVSYSTQDAGNVTESYSNSGKSWYVGLRGDTANGFSISDQTAQRLFVDAAGNIGIGTVSPAVGLHVNQSAANTDGRVRISGTGDTNAAGIELLNNDSTKKWDITTRASSNDDLWFSGYNGSSWTSAMVLGQNGNVGIGTTSPGAIFEVAKSDTTTFTSTALGVSTANARIRNTNGGNTMAELQFAGAGGSNFAAISGVYQTGVGNTQGDLVFSTRNATSDATLTDRMHILANGNVGIGTTSPAAQLDILNAVAQAALTVRGNSATNWMRASIFSIDTGASGRTYSFGSRNGIGFHISDETAGQTRLVVDATGNVGIGTIAPIRRLMVEDSGPQLALRNSSATAGVYWTVGPDGAANNFTIYNHNSTGLYVPNNGTSWIANSDRRLKERIESLPSALDSVTAMRGVYYFWKDKKRHDPSRQVGVIAQEVQAVYPELVTEDSKGNLGVNYSGLVAPLIEAVKELKADNDNLRAALEAQGREIEALKAAR